MPTPLRLTFLCPSAPFPVGGVTALYGFANALQRRGHTVTLLHCPFFGNRIESLDDLSWYAFEPGVRHLLVEPGETDLPEGDIFFGPADRPGIGLPVVIVQGFEMLHTGLEKQGFGYPCLKVCVAGWLVDVGRRLGVPAEQLVHVPMGIDVDRYRVTTPLEARGNRVAVLHSSHRAKGWTTALEALERAQRRVPDLQVTAFGTAAPPGELPAWLTFVLDPDQDRLVEEIYNGARVFLQASDYEGFGLTAVEAMASGCALVTTDNGGSGDYALPGETAVVVPAGDAVALADGVVDLLTDDAMRLRLADAGRALVRRFDWDVSAAVLEDVLRAYLADPDRHRQPYTLAHEDEVWRAEGAIASQAGR